MNTPADDAHLHMGTLLDACQRCAWFLNASVRKVDWPVSAGHLASRSTDLSLFEPLAAINERFAKLQDLLGSAMRQLCVLSGENTDTFLRVMAFCCKVGILDSMESWQLCRAVRNQAAHDYATDFKRTAEHFNAVHSLVPMLTRATVRLSQFASENLKIRSSTPELLEDLRRRHPAPAQD